MAPSKSLPHATKKTIHFSSESRPYAGKEYDYLFQSWLGQYTNWLSPASNSLAFSDWLMHLAISPARQIDLIIAVA